MKLDTIVAIATPPGLGAIGVIRISGDETFGIMDQIFSGKKISTVPSHTIHYGHIKNNIGEIIDEVVVSVFRNPHSYTKEDVVEISCHGSSFILQKVIELILEHGAKLAEPGEFTKRAYLHGRFDLSQAEAVADLIASESKAQHDIALQQMKGGFSNDLKLLREKLINFTSLIELELDFAEEDVEFANRDDLKNLVNEILQKLIQLINSFQLGNAIKNGIPTVIAGRPNAGKSTLLNALLNDERAIVSNIAGTTRDTIEEELTIQGTKFRLVDTAGIRDTTNDEIEKIGIEKTKAQIEKSEILIYLFDASNSSINEVLEDILQYYRENTKLLILGNKIDLLDDRAKEKWLIDLKQLHASNIHYDFVGISAREKMNLTLILDILASYASIENAGNTIVTNVRHYEALRTSVQALEKVLVGLEQRISGDLLSMDIKKALYSIGSITGEIDVDADILGTIFGKFCIGK